MKITSTLKVAEFPDAAEAVVYGHGEQLRNLLLLIESQTQAKQKKFWRYFDTNTVKCANCDSPVLIHRIYKTQITSNCCSLGCSIEYAEAHPIQSKREVVFS
jgi:hypothetical protein